jgi:hypothetical protein
MIRAYNDWHVDGWCGAEPGRFIPLSLPVLWDPELAAAEVTGWMAERGCHAVTFSENPAKLGWPSSTASTGTRSGPPVPTRRWSCACTSARPPS